MSSCLSLWSAMDTDRPRHTKLRAASDILFPHNSPDRLQACSADGNYVMFPTVPQILGNKETTNRGHYNSWDTEAFFCFIILESIFARQLWLPFSDSLCSK